MTNIHIHTLSKSVFPLFLFPSSSPLPYFSVTLLTETQICLSAQHPLQVKHTESKMKGLLSDEICLSVLCIYTSFDQLLLFFCLYCCYGLSGDKGKGGVCNAWVCPALWQNHSHHATAMENKANENCICIRWKDLAWVTLNTKDKVPGVMRGKERRWMVRR